MIDKNGEKYAESLEEYYATCGVPELKEGAQAIVDQNIDLAARYPLSDEEYEVLKQPIRIY